MDASQFISTGTYFSPGIYTHVKVSSIEKGKTKDTDYIDIKYETTENSKRFDEEGNSTVVPKGIKDRKRIFYPRPDKVFIKEGETKEQAFERAKYDFMKSLSTHAFILLGKDVERLRSISDPNFISLADKLVDVINRNKDAATFNVKVRYDKTLTFSEIPGEGTSWFEEGSDIPRLSFSTWEMNKRLKRASKDNSDIADLLGGI